MDIASKISSINGAAEAQYFERKAQSAFLSGAWKDETRTKDAIAKFKAISDVLSNTSTKITMVISIFGIHFRLQWPFIWTSYIIIWFNLFSSIDCDSMSDRGCTRKHPSGTLTTTRSITSNILVSYRSSVTPLQHTN